MIYAGRSWHAPAQHTGPSTTSTVRCPSSFPAPESRVVYTNSGMDLAAAVACRRHSRLGYRHDDRNQGDDEGLLDQQDAAHPIARVAVRVRRPRRRARPGLATRAAAPPGHRLLRGHPHRADPGRLRRHPGLSGAAIRLYRDTFRRLGLLGGQGQEEGQDGQDGDGQQPTGKAGERFKVACGCQPPRSFWIRAKQYAPGPMSCGTCGQDLQPQDIAPGRRQQRR